MGQVTFYRRAVLETKHITQTPNMLQHLVLLVLQGLWSSIGPLLAQIDKSQLDPGGTADSVIAPAPAAPLRGRFPPPASSGPAWWMRSFVGVGPS